MVIPINRVYCKLSIYHKTSYNESGGESKFPKEDEEILPPAELLVDYFKKRKALNAVKFKLICRMFAIGKQKRKWEVLNTSDDRKNLHIEKSKASEL